jgi:hypothetical protein
VTAFFKKVHLVTLLLPISDAKAQISAAPPPFLKNNYRRENGRCKKCVEQKF